MRDDFTQKTKEKLAHRAGYRCSKLDCGILTRGAASDDEGIINTGVAAHITAAASGGPRYNPSLTSDERKAFSNGIWLCQNHGKLVDSDESHFTVEELLSWKRLSEQRSFLEVVSSKPSPVGAQLADDEDVQTVVDLFLDYSRSDLTAFKNTPEWPTHTIALNLKMAEAKSTEIFTVSGLASAVEVYDRIAVVAPPGTGKTTTLLQLMETILRNAFLVAVFIPLGEWSTRSDTFLQSLLHRVAFHDARERQFAVLAEHGRLVLILDGWNELDEQAKRRARNQIRSLRRDFPDIRLVISSRQKDLLIPIDGPVVEVDILTEKQQLEIAKGLRGSEGESLLDNSWRTSGLRELVAIPLYLSALLKYAPGGLLPTTKEEVLRFFVTELEQDPDKLGILRENLQGFHRAFLEGLAVEATREQTVALSEDQARAVVNTVQEQLRDAGQIAQLLQPMMVLNTLTSAHLLVQPYTESGGISFQHQQFQEWLASFWVQRLMLLAASGDSDAKKELREDVLDILPWEEAILFACDRLSRADQDSIQAVASAIIETLGIDPMLSAEMIFRSSDEVWEQVRDDVMSFVKKWHSEGHVDRAVKFMIDTGRAEFSKYIWPLISDPDNQVHLHALRSGRIFRVSVLGSDAEERIAELPEKLRVNVVSGIAYDGDMDGIEFATLLSRNDPSSEVKKSVIDALLFRQADRYAKDILESASDEIWRSLALKWYPHEIADPQLSARIQREAVVLLATETDPHKIINMLLLSNVRDPETGMKIRRLIEKIDFSEKSQAYDWIVDRSCDLYPEDVVSALVSLLESGKSVPFRTKELLWRSDLVIDEGPLVEHMLGDSEEHEGLESALCIIGPITIGHLIDQMFRVYPRIKANAGRYDKQLSDEYYKLSRWISKTKPTFFIQAVLERAETEKPDEIVVLAEFISRHGRSYPREPLELEKKAHRQATEAVQRWARTLLSSPEATRAQFAEIAQAVERLRSPTLVPVLKELLSEDLTRRKRAWEELVEAHKNGRQINNDGRMMYTLLYRAAFAAIGDDQTELIMKSYLPDPDFGVDAANVLKAVWKKTQPPEEKPGLLNSWPDFSVVPDEYAKRQSGSVGGTHVFVNEILAVVDDLIKPGAEEDDYKHALKLARVAFSMPYVDKEDTIASLLQLPLPTIDKQELLTVLALSGETIPSKTVLQGIDDLLDEAKTNPWVLQEQDGWRLNAWLKLLPFTEAVGSILDVLTRLEDQYLVPWRLRELLSALSYAPSIEAENVLGELVKRDERFLNEYNWLTALAKRNTLTAAGILLNTVCNASFSDKRRSRNSMDFGSELSAFMISHGQFRQEVYERFSRIADGPNKSILEYAIANAADIEGVLLLVRAGAAHDKRFRDTGLHTALHEILVGRTPIGSFGSYELYSLPAPELRKGLFDLVVNSNIAESRLATECLTAIDEIRDEYGHADAEPRHPDIALGVPWPQIGLAEPT
jgi:hypothetical protein